MRRKTTGPAPQYPSVEITNQPPTHLKHGTQEHTNNNMFRYRWNTCGKVCKLGAMVALAEFFLPWCNRMEVRSAQRARQEETAVVETEKAACPQPGTGQAESHSQPLDRLKASRRTGLRKSVLPDHKKVLRAQRTRRPKMCPQNTRFSKNENFKLSRRWSQKS